MNKAIFLDLGGTIIYDKGLEKFFKEAKVGNVYVIKPEYVMFIPQSLDALKMLSKTTYKLIITTNVPAITSGCCTEKELLGVKEKVIKEAIKQGGRIDGFYYCPHRGRDNCECRKPKQGMLLKAIEEHNLFLQGNWMVGDKTSDVKFGRDGGCKTILVETGYAGKDGKYEIEGDYKLGNLFKAAQFITNESR